jgi:general secretion pathway protein B
MSYILEALRKAEEKREQEEPSKVPTFLMGTARESGRRVMWPYFLLVAALLLNAGLALWRLTPRETPSAPASVETPAPIAPAAVARVPAKDLNKHASPALRPQKTTVAVVHATPKPPAASETASNPKVRVEKPRPTASGTVLSLSELPPAVRSALPAFRISGHAYTPEPQTRVVRVNEKILQEGQDLLPGLRVEEIVQGGIIMSYEGYRFRININETN